MIRFLSAISCFCLFLNGCAIITNIKQETVPIEQWTNSPEAQRGYIYLSGNITPAKATNLFKKVNELNKNKSIERIRLVVNVIGDDETPLDLLMRAIRISKKDIDVINIGACYASNVALYVAATGKRYAFPDTDFGIISHKREDYRKAMETIQRFDIIKYNTILKENTGLPEAWLSGKDGPVFLRKKKPKNMA